MVTLTLSVLPWTSTLISRLIALVANGHLDSVGSLLYSAPMVVVTLSALVVSWMATMALSTPVIHIAGSTGLSVCLFHTDGFKSTVGSPCSSLLFIQFNVASLYCRSYRGTPIFGGTLSLSIDRSMLRSQPVLLSGLLTLSVVEFVTSCSAAQYRHHSP
jgi:hypothetical protein